MPVAMAWALKNEYPLSIKQCLVLWHNPCTQIVWCSELNWNQFDKQTQQTITEEWQNKCDKKK